MGRAKSPTRLDRRPERSRSKAGTAYRGAQGEFRPPAGDGPGLWFVYGENSEVRLLSVPLPAVTPAMSFPLSFPLPPIGTVGVLTELATASGGISCSEFKTVSTAP
jgi:hypothetical protein